MFLAVLPGANVAQTQQIDEPHLVGRGQPVGPLLATSSDGGGDAADLVTARPVQVLGALRPACLVTAPFQNDLNDASLEFAGALRIVPPRSCSQGSAL
jgi:hypothetical protein